MSTAASNTLTFTESIVDPPSNELPLYVEINGRRCYFGQGNLEASSDYDIISVDLYGTGGELSPTEAALALRQIVNFTGYTADYGVTLSISGGVVTATALDAGTAGNSITTITNVNGASWDTATLTGGTNPDNMPDSPEIIIPESGAGSAPSSPGIVQPETGAGGSPTAPDSMVPPVSAGSPPSVPETVVSPSSPATPTAPDVMVPGVQSPGTRYVRFDAEQVLSESESSQARENIRAAGPSAELYSLPPSQLNIVNIFVGQSNMPQMLQDAIMDSAPMWGGSDSAPEFRSQAGGQASSYWVSGTDPSYSLSAFSQSTVWDESEAAPTDFQNYMNANDDVHVIHMFLFQGESDEGFYPNVLWLSRWSWFVAKVEELTGVPVRVFAAKPCRLDMVVFSNGYGQVRDQVEQLTPYWIDTRDLDRSDNVHIFDHTDGDLTDEVYDRSINEVAYRLNLKVAESYGVQVQRFTPYDYNRLSSLVLDFDARDIEVTLGDAAESFTDWTDRKSGITVSSGVYNDPVWIGGAGSGYPAAGFCYNAQRMWMQNIGIGQTLFQPDLRMHVFLVFASTNERTIERSTLFHIGNTVRTGGSDEIELQSFVGLGHELDDMSTVGVADGASSIAVASGITEGDVNIFEWERAVGAKINETLVRINGVDLAALPTAAGDYVPNNLDGDNMDIILMGSTRVGNTPSGSGSGRLLKALFFNAPLTSAQAIRVREALNREFNLGIDL